MDEADLLFGRLFPRILVHLSGELSRFRGRVAFRVRGDDRGWVLSGGKPPWLRSADGGGADVTFTLSAALVRRIVHGGDLDLAQAAREGALEIDGELAALRDLAQAIDPPALLAKLAPAPASVKRVPPRPSAPPAPSAAPARLSRRTRPPPKKS
jgi:hypothetical protein